MKKRLFIDMDGTLAKFKKVDKLETLYEPGYFKNLEPHTGVIEAVKDIIKNRSDIEVYILSSVLSDSKYAIPEKNGWLNEHLPEIDEKHRLYPPCGQDKKSFIPNLSQRDFLFDDYTRNLLSWDPPGSGIKILNGINNTRGTWKKATVAYDKNPAEISRVIQKYMDYAREQGFER